MNCHTSCKRLKNLFQLGPGNFWVLLMFSPLLLIYVNGMVINTRFEETDANKNRENFFLIIRKFLTRKLSLLSGERIVLSFFPIHPRTFLILLAMTWTIFRCGTVRTHKTTDISFKFYWVQDFNSKRNDRFLVNGVDWFELHSTVE